MNSTAWTVAKLNLRNLRVAWWITGVVFVLLVANVIVYWRVSASGVDLTTGSSIGFGNALWLMPVLAAIFIPAMNYRRIVNLGGRRAQYFWGVGVLYVLLAAGVSLVNTALYYAADRPITDYGRMGGWWNLTQVFGWTDNGPLLAFVQQFAFLLLFTAFVNVLVLLQDKWYGIALDVVIIAIISVFTPIAPLRHALASFFHLVIFGQAGLQILACLVIAVVLYAATKPILAAKPI
ncbi:MAG: hypothetical protein FWF75_08175 [Propionibacteriaceae bacterium]|nr:hypothetical protein [Propionibacteriaceae bacterium]